MAVVIEFENEEEHIKALDILAEAQESYEGAAKGIIVSNKAARLLKEHTVRFHPVGDKNEEARYASNP